MRLVETNGNTDDADEELADEHTKGTTDQDGAAAELLNSPKGEGSRADVDQVEDEGDEEGVGDGSSGLEEGSRVVEDKVDTSPLLHHLERGTEDGAAKVGLGLPETSLEAVGPAAEPGSRGDKGTLILFVGNDLSDLTLNVLGLSGLTTDTGQSSNGGLDVTALDEVAGRVGQEEETGGEDDSPGELNANGDTILAGVAVVLGSIDDNRGEENTDGDAELVAGNKSTTNLAGANLGHVENDNGRLETDTETSNETTDDDGGESAGAGRGGNLNDATDSVDGAADNDGPLAADPVGEVTGDESTEESTARQDGDDQGLVRTAESGGTGTLDSGDENAGARDTIDVTGVITEEDTTKGGKGAHEIGLPSDGSLDVLDIDGGSEGDGALAVVQAANATLLFGERHGEGCWCNYETVVPLFRFSLVKEMEGREGNREVCC